MTRQEPTPKAALMMARVIWAALLMGQLVFAAVTWTMVNQSPPAEPADTRVLFYVALACLALILPVAILLRFRLLGSNTSPIPVPKYMTANTIFLAICEGQTFLLLAFALTSRQIMPFFPLAGLPLAVFLAGFPRNPGWKV